MHEAGAGRVIISALDLVNSGVHVEGTKDLVTKELRRTQLWSMLMQMLMDFPQDQGSLFKRGGMS